MGLGALQPMHLLIILAIVLLIVGPRKLGNIGGALGQSVREFKQATKEETEDKKGSDVEKVSTTSSND